MATPSKRADKRPEASPVKTIVAAYFRLPKKSREQVIAKIILANLAGRRAARKSPRLKEKSS